MTRAHFLILALTFVTVGSVWCEEPASRQAPPEEFSVLAQRLGTWDTQTTIKPGVWVRDGLKSKGVETIEWVLGKRFIQGSRK
jgi:hypothetical protein